MNEQNREAMERRRRRLLISSLVGFSVWQICLVARHAMTEATFPLKGLLLGVGLSGFGLWFFQMLQVVKFQGVLKRDPALAQALTDERYEHAILRSHATTFWVLLCTAGGLMAWSAFFPLSGRIAAQLFLIIAVCSATIALLIYDRE